MNKQIGVKQLNKTALRNWALVGGGIAFVLIGIFLLDVRKPNPEWPTFWMVRPLFIVPFAGALGGAMYYFTSHLAYQKGWQKVLLNVVGLFIYIIGLWLGTVLGLDGTLWH